jgi:hypothetical protein
MSHLVEEAAEEIHAFLRGDGGGLDFRRDGGHEHAGVALQEHGPQPAELGVAPPHLPVLRRRGHAVRSVLFVVVVVGWREGGQRRWWCGCVAGRWRD